jgi:hypothetical protein
MQIQSLFLSYYALFFYVVPALLLGVNVKVIIIAIIVLLIEAIVYNFSYNIVGKQIF